MNDKCRELLKLIEQQGWVLTKKGNKHIRCQAPDGRLVFVSASPSDHRAWLKQRAIFRRNGAKV